MLRYPRSRRASRARGTRPLLSFGSRSSIELSTLIGAFADALEDEELSYDNYCIQGARLTRRVFAHFGAPVELLNTAVICTTGRGMADFCRPQPFVSFLDDIATVRCGGAEPIHRDCSGEWNAHLVALVGGRYLVDPAVEQFRRAEHALEMPAVLVSESRSMASPLGEHISSYRGRIGTTYLWYSRCRWDDRVKHLPAWRDPIGDAMRAVIANMEGTCW